MSTGNLKGLILAGGKGTRLRPITHTSAKQLVPVANKPILYYAIEALAEAGVRDVGIVVGDTHVEIEAAVGDGSRFGIRATYIRQHEPLGLAHAVLTAQDFLGSDRFVMYLGDNLIKGGIVGVTQEFLASDADAQILLAHVPNPGDYGVAELAPGDGPNRAIVSLEEKPTSPRSDLALVGVYFFGPEIFRAAKAIKPSARGELEITDAITQLVASGAKVVSHIITGWWKDTGKLEDLLEANRILLDDLEPSVRGKLDAESKTEGKVSIGSGTKIIRSLLRGPCIIGDNCTIEDSYVGPYTSIYHGAQIRQSEVEHSIVLDDSRIEVGGARISDSLIGKEVYVGATDERPRAHRLMLGDASRVVIAK